MKYTMKLNKNMHEFGQLSIGELFLDEDYAPHIKICDVTNHVYGDILYNSIRLSTGDTWHFPADEMVLVPSDYELKILA